MGPGAWKRCGNGRGGPSAKQSVVAARNCSSGLPIVAIATTDVQRCQRDGCAGHPAANAPGSDLSVPPRGGHGRPAAPICARSPRLPSPVVAATGDLRSIAVTCSGRAVEAATAQLDCRRGKPAAAGPWCKTGNRCSSFSRPVDGYHTGPSASASAPSGRGRCSSSARMPSSQARHSSGRVRITGMALGWMRPTSALGEQVRKA